MGVVERGKKKEQPKLLVPELLCLRVSSRSFLAATCKILWIFPDVSSPSAQHHRPCAYLFYRVLLLPYLHTVSLPTSTHLHDRSGLLKQNGHVLFSFD